MSNKEPNPKLYRCPECKEVDLQPAPQPEQMPLISDKQMAGR